MMLSTQFENCWAVILAGGSGTRFWPKSLQSRPKQLSTLGNNKQTMIELTLKRLDPIIPPERRIIVTHKNQTELTRKIVGDSCFHIISEPFSKNTAAALTLASFEIKFQTDSNHKPIMLSFHADHIIKEENLFYQTLVEAVSLAKKNYLSLIGIKPKKADTAFGYIKTKNKISERTLPNSYSVDNFCEKPNLALAQKYLAAGNYYWNSGIFIWKNQIFLEEIQQKINNTYSKINHFYSSYRHEDHCFQKPEFHTLYNELDEISIDHAILEKSSKIAMISSAMNWADIGSWDALPEVFPTDPLGNLVSGDSYLYKTKNCVIDSKEKFVATLGLTDIIVVAIEDSILVCHKDQAQEVKRVVAHLKEKKKNDFL